MNAPQSPKGKLTIYGHVTYRCQRSGCDRLTEPIDTWWSDDSGMDVLHPPLQPPAPPNPYRPYCSVDHLPRRST